jgi:predicted metal-dependent enzyme (double-stranded beta helix superfamily)
MTMARSMNLSTIEEFCNQLPNLTLAEAGSALAWLAHDPNFLAAHLSLLQTRIPPAVGPYIACSYGPQEGSACLQVFVWPAGARTPIHDHTAWGAYHCVAGSLFEERYERLDNEARPHTAHLRKLWQRLWGKPDGATTLQPFAGGIHRVTNRGHRPAMSLHLYGPRLGIVDGRDYDPSRDFVCDRLEPENLIPRPAPITLTTSPI